jgi:hypothetical protein
MLIVLASEVSCVTYVLSWGEGLIEEIAEERKE